MASATMSAEGSTGAAERARWASRHVPVAGAIVLLTLIGFFHFPGHTFLQSDTQIYLPILERFWNETLFRNELVAQDPHVSFTIYDEMALLLRRATGLEFGQVLAGQQLIYRALGILGVFLLATALGLSQRMALLVAALFSLGATIAGPTVLTVEYEPVPRGFAIPLLLLALGLVAHGRDLGAGVAAGLAFLYHPPAVLTFWGVYFALTLWPNKPAIMSRRIAGLLPMLCAVLVLTALSRMQAGIGEPQDFFGRIDPELERMQRMRASYNWISMWATHWITHYVFLWVVSVAAFWRVRKSASQDVKFFFVGLPLTGLLTIPLTYVLLERFKWTLVPQVQPARALLFVTALAGILASIAAVKAGERGRYWESALWLLPVFAIPLHTRVLQLLVPDFSAPLVPQRFVLLIALACLALFAIWAETRKRRWSAAPWAAAVLLPFLLIPGLGSVRNYPRLHTPELGELTAWARASTPEDAVFLFPDAGRELYPGIFRANGLRAVYVCWKAGGQVNFLRNFADEWWWRWQTTGAGKFRPQDAPSYASMGIDYFVLKAANALPGREPVFRNAHYVVYRTDR